MRVRTMLALGALLAMLLPGTATAQVRVRVQAPPTVAAPAVPEIIATAAECNAYIVVSPKRSRCLSCVAGGHRFHRQGDAGFGHCAMPVVQPPPPPPPPAANEYLTTGTMCVTFVVNPVKRNRCFECVRRGHTFHKQGEHGFGACLGATPPPPPPAVELLYNVGQCNTYVALYPKRVRCIDCVNRGGTFHKQGDAGYGHCALPAVAPATLEYLTTPGHCVTYLVNPHKRNRCFECVRRGGTFNKQGDVGFGHCTLPAVAPPPPPPPPPPPAATIITDVGACYSMISHPGTRNHCRKCVQRGGRWDLRGFCIR